MGNVQPVIESRSQAWESALISGNRTNFASVLSEYQALRSRDLFDAVKELSNIRRVPKHVWDSFVKFATDSGFAHFADFADFLHPSCLKGESMYTPYRLSSGVFGVSTKFLSPNVCFSAFPPLLDSSLHILDGQSGTSHAIVALEACFLTAIGLSILAGKPSLYWAKRDVVESATTTGAETVFTFGLEGGSEGYRLPTIRELTELVEAGAPRAPDAFQWVSAYNPLSVQISDLYPTLSPNYTDDDVDDVGLDTVDQELESKLPVCEWALTSSSGTRAVPVRVEGNLVRIHPELMDKPHMFRLVRRLGS